MSHRSDGLLGKMAPDLLGHGFGSKNDIFFAAVEMTRMPIILTDPNQPDNPIVFCNPAFLELTGYDEHEIVGNNCRFLQGPDTDREQVNALRNAIEARADVSVEIINYRKDGSTFWNALFISPVFDQEGNLMLFFASQLDVTRRRNIEDALRQAQKMEAVGQLTGGIAHDFNNMLTVVMGNIEQALSRASDPRQQRELERSMEAATKAEKLTAQLLAFARQQRLESRPTNINLMTSNIRDLAQRTLGSQIEITMNYAPDIDIAEIDSVQAEVAVLNILINARDAMPNGGKLCISTRNEVVVTPTDMLSKGDYVVVSVQDSGSGIDPGNLKRVTEPFFTTKEIGKGTGMGLAMVYGFMKQSRGAMVISSEVGQGTTVELYFPSSGKHRHLNVVSLTKALPVMHGGETILVVEDNSEVLQMAEQALIDAGYHVITATDAIAGLRIVEERNADIDMLFTDIVMPGGMDGRVLADKVHAKYSKIKILLTSGWTDRQHETSMQNTTFELVQKPYRPSVLLNRIKQIFDATPHEG